MRGARAEGPHARPARDHHVDPSGSGPTPRLPDGRGETIGDSEHLSRGCFGSDFDEQPDRGFRCSDSVYQVEGARRRTAVSSGAEAGSSPVYRVGCDEHPVPAHRLTPFPVVVRSSHGLSGGHARPGANSACPGALGSTAVSHHRRARQ